MRLVPVLVATSAFIAISSAGSIMAGTNRGVTRRADPPAPAAAGAASVGQDVIVAAISDLRFWGTDTEETAYSIGTTSCNVGDMNLTWQQAPSNQHPVISQNMYRLADGRLEQLGQAWLKHGFCALQNAIIPPCGDCPGGSGCYQHLKPGCSDPYTAGRNGTQVGLGPKWQVNAFTGAFPVPFDQGEGTSGSLRRRLRVPNATLDPTVNPGALYFVEGHYVHPGDSTDGNQNNNASYREVQINVNGLGQFILTFQIGSQTIRERSGPEIWADHDPAVTVVDAQVAGEGLFRVGYKVWEAPAGTWNYEYAVYNMNSDRSARAFSLPVDDGVNVTATDFHDIAYHSGDGEGGSNFDGTDWTTTLGAGMLEWKTEAHIDNVSANALRWGTMYNFRFQSDVPPVAGDAEIGLFKSGSPTSLTVPVLVPASTTAGCDEDISGDGLVGFQDVLMIISAWGTDAADVNGNGVADFQDVLMIVSAWGEC